MRTRAIAAARTLLPILIVPAVLAVAWPLLWPIDSRGSDAPYYWYAGHLVATGSSPYDLAAWNCQATIAVCAWVYPPLTAWLFAPFGVLPADTGAVALYAVGLMWTVLGTVAVVFRFGPRSPMRRAAVLLTLAAAEPFIVNIRWTHLAGLLLLGLVLVSVGLRERRNGVLASGAILLSLEPHLFVMLVPLVAFWLVRERGWGSILDAATTATAIGAATIAISPGAVGTITRLTAAKASISTSTVWTVSGAIVPQAQMMVFGLTLTGATLLAVRAIAFAPVRQRSDVLVAAGCALSLVAAPYAQPYDWLLLAPPIALVARSAATPTWLAAIAIVALSYTAGTWLVVGLWDRPGEILFATMPLAVLVVLAAVARTTPVGSKDVRTAPGGRRDPDTVQASAVFRSF